MSIVPAVLARVGVPVLMEVLSDVLRGSDHPAAGKAADALSDLDQIITAGVIPPEQIEDMNRHIEALAEIKSREIGENIAHVNQTIQAEISSQDQYVRRMRPTFGYLMALTWAAQMFGLAYVMIFRTSEAHLVLEAVESLSMIWTVGLSVLGIYVYKRSEDKKINVPATSVSAVMDILKKAPDNVLDNAKRSVSSYKLNP